MTALTCISTTERTTVRLPKELLRQARAKAASDGRTLTSLIEEGVRSIVLPGNRRTSTSAPLPVSKNSGGLQPGFVLADMTTIYEAEDLATVAKSIRDPS